MGVMSTKEAAQAMALEEAHRRTLTDSEAMAKFGAAKPLLSSWLFLAMTHLR